MIHEGHIREAMEGLRWCRKDTCTREAIGARRYILIVAWVPHHNATTWTVCLGAYSRVIGEGTCEGPHPLYAAKEAAVRRWLEHDEEEATCNK